jgi:hypothetical protein
MPRHLGRCGFMVAAIREHDGVLAPDRHHARDHFLLNHRRQHVALEHVSRADVVMPSDEFVHEVLPDAYIGVECVSHGVEFRGVDSGGELKCRGGA